MVQHLAGRHATLSGFLAKSAKHNLLFFKTLRGSKPFKWMKECQDAFEALKTHLSDFKTLAIPLPGERLLLYLSASVAVISAMLIWKAKNEGCFTHMAVYYISEALSEAKMHYIELKKIAYALLMASRKL